MNKNIRFSIITVCYNSEKTIKETMDSILLQEYKNYEYIIIDGASKDKTVELIKCYEKSFEGKLKFISEEDNGIYDAMNKAIKEATGDYLIFINSGDELCNGILQKTVEILNLQRDEYDIVYGDSIVVYVNGEKKTTKIRKANEKVDLKSLKNGMGIVHQSIFVKRELFKKIGGFNIEYTLGADWDFLIRCVKNNCLMYYLNMPVSVFETFGASSKVHNMQRHKIRKANQLYKTIDFNLLKDFLNVETMIQLFIGEELYRKLRYYKNK